MMLGNTNLRPGQPPETNLPGCRTSPVDLAKPWEHLKPTCFAAARTSNMSLHTSGHVVAPKSGLFACHHASNADGEPRKNDTLNQYRQMMLGNKPIYGLDSHLKPTCQAAAHPLSTLQSLGNISNQPALQPQEPAT